MRKPKTLVGVLGFELLGWSQVAHELCIVECEEVFFPTLGTGDFGGRSIGEDDGHQHLLGGGVGLLCNLVESVEHDVSFHRGLIIGHVILANENLKPVLGALVVDLVGWV